MGYLITRDDVETWVQLSGKFLILADAIDRVRPGPGEDEAYIMLLAIQDRLYDGVSAISKSLLALDELRDAQDDAQDTDPA